MIFCLSLSSCSSDEPGSGGEKSNSTFDKAIRDVFTGLRIDSISSHEDYGNIKINYSNGLLTNYSELYDNGKIHDGETCSLSFNKNSVNLSYFNKNYNCEFGDNGYVSRMISEDQKVVEFAYDDDNHLIMLKDNYRVYDLEWENGNLVHYRATTLDSGNYCDYYYAYNDAPNIAGILPPMRSYYWLSYSLAYETLYYAGLLGKGTSNLPIRSSNRYENGQSNQSYKFEYDLDENGYILSVEGKRVILSHEYDLGKDYYFYK